NGTGSIARGRRAYCSDPSPVCKPSQIPTAAPYPDDPVRPVQAIRPVPARESLQASPAVGR
ncbi:MAG: hypothetical protein LC745_01470, partial [Planctomycetia bacterium]|nr:hypothetical protein [Planctomycetia bacterium]